VVRVTLGAERLEQGGQVGFEFPEGDRVRCPVGPAPHGVQDQERLLRGALVSSAPDAEPVEAVEVRLRVHGPASDWSEWPFPTR